MRRAHLAALAPLGWVANLARAAPTPESGWTLPHDASLNGFRIDRLIRADAWLEIPLLVALMLWLLFAAVAHGRKHKAVYDPGGFRHPLAIGFCLLALAILVTNDALSWASSNHDMDDHFWNFAAAESQPNAVRIEVNAHQWAWTARYPGPDGRFDTADDIVTLDDLRVPVGAPVILELASTDVIHDFYLPNFRIKQDVVPGTINRLTFTAKETGEFDIGCAQHCGLNHYKMKGLLTVLAPADYAAWAATASRNGARQFDPKDSIAHWGWPWQAAPRQGP